MLSHKSFENHLLQFIHLDEFDPEQFAVRPSDDAKDNCEGRLNTGQKHFKLQRLPFMNCDQTFDETAGNCKVQQSSLSDLRTDCKTHGRFERHAVFITWLNVILFRFRCPV
jgi:hypothetical protein